MPVGRRPKTNNNHPSRPRLSRANWRPTAEEDRMRSVVRADRVVNLDPCTDLRDLRCSAHLDVCLVEGWLGHVHEKDLAREEAGHDCGRRGQTTPTAVGSGPSIPEEARQHGTHV